MHHTSPRRLRRALPAFLAAGAIALAGCTTTDDSAAPASSAGFQPVTLSDCAGKTTEFTAPPAKLATGNTAALEILLRLGLTEKEIIGTGWSGGTPSMPAEVRDAASRIPSLGERAIVVENLLTSGADTFVDPYGAMQMMGTPGVSDQQLADAGMRRVFLRSSACQRDQKAPLLTLDGVYSDISDLARLTGRTTEGERLVEGMRTRIAAATAKEAPGSESGARPAKVLYLSMGRGDDPTSIGNRQIGNAIITLAGGQNAFADRDEPQFSPDWESVVAADPDVIVIGVRRQASDAAVDGEYEKTLAKLRAGDRTKDLRAVREGRFLRVFAEDFTLPGVGNADAVDQVAGALRAAR